MQKIRSSDVVPSSSGAPRTDGYQPGRGQAGHIPPVSQQPPKNPPNQGSGAKPSKPAK